MVRPDNLLSVQAGQIKSRTTSPYSLMPTGLVTGMNGEELRDLIAYLLSGGDQNDPAFKPVP